MTSTRIAGLLVILCLAFIACAEHRLTDDVASGGVGGSQMSNAASSGAGGAGGAIAGGAGDAGGADAGGADASASEPVECTIAHRLDACCFDAVAVTRDELRADPCLFEYPEGNVDIEDYERCRPDDCDPASCGSHRPPSFIVAPSATGCAFVDECTQPSDCVLATEQGECCMCPQAMPASVVLGEACFVAESEDIETTASCPFGCFGGPGSSCEACPARAAPTCLIRDSTNVCQ
jgi:hypothetical protein